MQDFTDHRHRFPVPMGLFSGLLGVLAFPEFHAWPLAFVAYIPLLIAIRNQQPLVRFLSGLACGTLLHLAVYHWVRHTMISMSDLSPSVATVVLVAFALTGGLLQAFFAILAEPVRKWTGSWYWFYVPALYVVLEWVFPHLFSWYLGNSLYRQITLIQISDITGVYGLSFWLMASSSLLANLYVSVRHGGTIRRAWPPALIWLGLFIVITAYGSVRLHQLDQIQSLHSLRVAIIQPYVTPEDKKLRGKDRKVILDKALATTRTLPEQPYDVVLWPEGSFPYHYPSGITPERLKHPKTLADESAAIIHQLIKTRGNHWIFGTLRESSDGKQTHNSLVHVGPDGKVLEIYDKQKLVAFGEYMPFSDDFPALKTIISGVSDMSPGKSFKLIRIQNVRILPSICYEAIFPNFTREAVNHEQGADVIVNLTNDVWFGPTGAPELHLMVQTHRAVELRVPLVRVTNSGISAIIAPSGDITQRTTVNTSTVMTEVVEIKTMGSFYRKFGDVFVYSLILAGLLMLARLRFRKSTRPRTPENSLGANPGIGI